jgi:hypothetical protein
MAMNKGLKWALIIGGVGVSGVALYFLWKKVIKPKLDGGDVENNKQFGSDEEVKSDEYNAQPRANYEDTPFQNKAEGDKFRAWVNDNYPKYAKEIDLDRSGDFNNSYIKKAYAKYGAKYTQSVKDADVSSRKNNPLSSEFKSLLSSWKKPLYYNKEGVAYFMLKFKKDGKAWGSDSECRGTIYIFNTSVSYLNGKTNDKRGIVAIYWDKKQLGSAYWSNYLKNIDGKTGCLEGIKITNPKSFGKEIAKSCDMPNFAYC